jgi:hypothetical protein
LLDRVVARVGGVAITETDVRAAVGLGLIELPSGADPIMEGTPAMIDRQLVLREVNRFKPPPPEESAITEAVAAMKVRVGARLPTLMQSTGLDDNRLRELARDTLWIQTYVNQRFGTTAQASLQDAREYYEKHPEEFRRNGTVLPFEQVETAARTAASNERRRTAIAGWIKGLRARGDVVELRN